MENGKLLLVDDEPEILILVGNWLRVKGYDVVTAPDGHKAMEVFNNQRPDLVLLDLHLPDLDGLEILRMIKEIDPEAGVIMMSADLAQGSLHLILNEGACDFIGKPINFAYLATSVSANMFVRSVRTNSVTN